LIQGIVRNEKIGRSGIIVLKEGIFSSREEFKILSEILQQWTDDGQGVKDAFVRLAERFSKKNNVVLSFVSRPGVSYSLRGSVRAQGGTMTLVTLIDIVDDPESRWLSVCFYDACVTDPAEEGNMVPKGVLGIDGYCFDLFENSEGFSSYLEQRIDEAYENTLLIC